MLNWGEKLFGLVIPEGAVHRVRHGATVLWDSIYRSAHALLGIRQSYEAESAAVEAVPIEAEDTVAIESEPTAVPLPAVPAEGAERCTVTFRAEADCKLISFGESALSVDCEVKGEMYAPESTPAEADAAVCAKLESEAHAPESAPVQSDAAICAEARGEMHTPESMPTESEHAILVGAESAADTPESAPAGTEAVASVTLEAEAASREAASATSSYTMLAMLAAANTREAASAASDYTMLAMLAAANTAEGWEYPRKTSSYMVLNRVAGAVVYDARSGGKGLEVS